MMRHLVTCGICFLLVACDSSVTDSVSYQSPNGKRAISVVEELQGANDPAPWWTHVSILDAQDDPHQIPGNLLKLKGRGSVSAQWNGNAEVTIFVDESLFASQVSNPALHKGGVQITFRRDSDQDKNNSELGGERQPTTAPDAKSEGNEKSKPESEGRSQ